MVINTDALKHPSFSAFTEPRSPLIWKKMIILLHYHADKMMNITAYQYISKATTTVDIYIKNIIVSS